MSEYRLVRAEVEGFKKISLVSLVWDPDKNVMVIGGNNAQGKSSLIDGIWWALKSKASGVTDPINRGSRRAIVKLDLGDIIATRTSSASGTKLLVETKDGAIIRSPQALLDEICGDLAFDPLAFCRMKQKEQKELLQRLVGLNFDDLEEKRTLLYEARTGIGRDLKRASGAYESMAVPEGEIPQVPVSVADLMTELTERESFNKHIDNLIAENEKRKQDVEGFNKTMVEIEDKKRGLLKELALIEERLSKGKDLIDSKMKEIDLFEASAMPARKSVEEVRDKIRNADLLNSKVRKRQEREVKRQEVEDLKERYAGFTEDIKAIDKDKEDQLLAIKMPLTGLGLDEDGVLFNKIPLSQASSAEQMRVSLALAVAQKPQLKLAWIKDGSLLDDDSMKDIARIANEYDIQVFIERVGKSDKGAILIQDGAIVEDIPTEEGVTEWK